MAKAKAAKRPKLDGAAAGPAGADTAAGSAAGTPGGGRKWTLSVAVPGSLLDAPASLELAVATAGQLARALATFQADEVVVYDPAAAAVPSSAATHAGVSAGTALLARLLQFLDTPPHLRPSLHDVSRPELRLAAALPAPGPPHHARPSGAWIPYREGVVLKSEPGAGSYVDVGLDRMVWLEHELPQYTRVTVHLGDTEPETRFMAAYSETMIVGTVVAPSAPRERLGLYWGYSVRIAQGLQRVFKDADVSRTGTYDLTIGSSPTGAPTDPSTLVLPNFKHALLVLGDSAAAGAKEGHAGGSGVHPDLEAAIKRVPDWEHKLPQDVFNLFLNTTPHLGTLHLCAEDAVGIALSYLVTPLLKHGRQ